MNCEAARNRLLALPDPRRASDELRGHLDGCPACRSFLAAVGRLDELLAAIPVPPPSEEVKAAFLDRMTEAGPIIRRLPVVPRRDSSLTLRALARGGAWRYAAGLAAGLLIAVGGWLLLSGKKSDTRREYVRHELLNQEVRFLVELARADTPQQRMKTWVAWNADLQEQVRAVHKYAPDETLKDLTTEFDKTARQGILGQAQLADRMPADQRQKVFKEAIDRLSKAEADANNFAQDATESAKPRLRHIARTAREVRAELVKLEPGAAGKGAS